MDIPRKHPFIQPWAAAVPVVFSHGMVTRQKYLSTMGLLISSSKESIQLLGMWAAALLQLIRFALVSISTLSRGLEGHKAVHKGRKS